MLCVRVNLHARACARKNLGHQSPSNAISKLFGKKLLASGECACPGIVLFMLDNSPWDGCKILFGRRRRSQ